jgi:tripartite-type tricarboxylate transporter receptor subunit TctC
MRAQPIWSFLAALVLVAALVSGVPRPARAEDWPTRPITMVSAFPLGGLSDVVVRELNNELSVDFGQRVLLEARPGAGGAIASSYVAKMPPDGYTLLMTAVGPVVFRPLIDISAGYTDADFTPIILIGESPNILVANSKIGAFLKKPENKARFAEQGIRLLGGTPKLLNDRVAKDRATWAPFISGLHLTPDK